MEIRLLCLGDVVGRPGRNVIRERLPEFKRERGIAACIANGENAARGSGITANTVKELFAAGVDLLTMGDHTWKRAEAVALITGDPRVIRPANYPPAAVGRGWTVIQADGVAVGVLNLLGRVYMEPVDCPFRTAQAALEAFPGDLRVIVVDLHAEATSEKMAMGWFLDGRVSAVVGSHTHVQTADERVLPKGTAYITDMGMTGPYESVIGREVEPVLKKFVTGMHHPYQVATGDARMCGVVVTVDAGSGRARAIERVQLS